MMGVLLPIAIDDRRDNSGSLPYEGFGYLAENGRQTDFARMLSAVHAALNKSNVWEAIENRAGELSEKGSGSLKGSWTAATFSIPFSCPEAKDRQVPVARTPGITSYDTQTVK